MRFQREKRNLIPFWSFGFLLFIFFRMSIMPLSSEITYSSSVSVSFTVNYIILMTWLTIRTIIYWVLRHTQQALMSRVTSASLCFEKFIRGKQIILQTTVQKDMTACSCLMWRSGPSTCCFSNHRPRPLHNSSCAVNQKKAGRAERGWPAVNRTHMYHCVGTQ